MNKLTMNGEIQNFRPDVTFPCSVQKKTRHSCSLNWEWTRMTQVFCRNKLPSWKQSYRVLTTETARYLLWSFQKVIYKTHLSYLLSLVFVSLSLVLVHLLFSCFDLLFLLVLDFMLSSRLLLVDILGILFAWDCIVRGTWGFTVLRYQGFFMRYFGNINLWYHLALRYAVFHHFG